MKLLTPEQARELDLKSSEHYGLSSDILMESAGALMAAQITTLYFSEIARGNITIVCGPGHNGADGFVIARHLVARGVKGVSVFTFGKGAELWKTQRQRILAQKINVWEVVTDFSMFKAALKDSSLIIDALFGSGLSKKIDGESERIVGAMNSANAPKASVDIPSGLDARTGRSSGVCVRADSTLSVGFHKPGFFICEGPEIVGKLHLIPLSYPTELVDQIATTHFAFDLKMAHQVLPPRGNFSNKSDYGKSLIIAGSPGMKGAAMLAAHGSARVGSGYVTLASLDPELASWKDSPEFLTLENADDESTWKNIKAQNYSAICLGPGLGRGDKTRKWIEFLKTENFENVILDADALFFAKDFFPLPKSWILTPHGGEAARMLGVTAEEIEADRCALAIRLSAVSGALVLLKGFHTVVATADFCGLILSGNSALAKAGSGDVLSGVITGFKAQNLKTFEAAALGAYIHGRCADRWVREGFDKSSLLPSDLLVSMPQIIAEIRGDRF